MASLTVLEQFIAFFKDEFKLHFSFLIGKTIESLEDVEVECHVKGIVTLSNGQKYPIHYRWTTEAEDASGKEFDDRYEKLIDYFSNHLKGRAITEIKLGVTDRDDEAYLLAYVHAGKEDQLALEIPVGFSFYEMEIRGGLAEEVISEQQFDDFKALVCSSDQPKALRIYQLSDQSYGVVKAYVETDMDEEPFSKEFSLFLQNEWQNNHHLTVEMLAKRIRKQGFQLRILEPIPTFHWYQDEKPADNQ